MSDSINHKNIVCPFCSLHCDDINLEINDRKISIKSDLPEVCADKYKIFNFKENKISQSKILGKSVDGNKANVYCQKLINSSKETILVNHSSDVNITREILGTASKINGIVDHSNSDKFLKNVALYQRRGYIATSLTEIKNKSDVILLFSNNVLQSYPRLIEKVLATSNSFSINPKDKKIFIIGNEKTNKKNYHVRDTRITFIDFNNKDVSSFLQSLKDKSKHPKVKNLKSKLLLESIDKSKYLSLLWSTSEFTRYKECDQIIYDISEFITSLNETKRAGCMSLAGNDGDVSHVQTLGWITGFPSRVKFTGNYFEYDKDTNNANKLINMNCCDLVIHINAISDKKLFLHKKQKNIIIGHPATKFNIEPDVFIPSSVPGIDSKGHIFRTDNVVSLPLSRIRIPFHKSVQEILRQIIH